MNFSRPVILVKPLLREELCPISLNRLRPGRRLRVHLGGVVWHRWEWGRLLTTVHWASPSIHPATCHQDLSPDKASHTCCAHCTHPPFLSNVPYSHCSSPTSVSSPGFILHSSLLFSLAPDHLSLCHRLLCNLGQHTPISLKKCIQADE